MFEQIHKTKESCLIPIKNSVLKNILQLCRFESPWLGESFKERVSRPEAEDTELYQIRGQLFKAQKQSKINGF